MEPTQYVRLLKRRWLFLFMCAALGAVIGYASTLIGGNDEGPTVTYWSAGQVLVINPESGATIDLQRVSVFATDGAVPKTVAEQRGIPENELRASIRTISNRADGTLTVSAVAASAEGARDIADDITQGLLGALNAEAAQAYAEELSDAQTKVDEETEEVAALDDQIDFLTAREATEDGLGPEQADDLRSLQVQRDTALLRLSQSETELSDLLRQGQAPSPLIELDSIIPFTISQREHSTWIARGQQGENNFIAGEVDLADTSAPTVSERLESPAARAALGALAGLILAIIAVIVHTRLDPRLRSREQVEAAFALPVLTEIPVISRKERRDGVLHARDHPRSAVAEAYRYLRSVLLFARSAEGGAADSTVPAPVGATAASPGAQGEREVRVVMITSAGEGEGKTTTATNLAVLMAEAGYETVLINCDFRLPTAHKAFHVPYEPGRVMNTGVENLRFIADVERHEADTPGQISERQRQLIRRAREHADLLILDTAPVLATNDAIDILPETDLVVLVAREAKTTADAAREARELLIERMGVPVAGVVVTAAGAGLGTGYYERYRYGSYFDPSNDTLWNVGKDAVGGRKAKKAAAAGTAAAAAAASPAPAPAAAASAPESASPEPAAETPAAAGPVPQAVPAAEPAPVAEPQPEPQPVFDTKPPPPAAPVEAAAAPVEAPLTGRKAKREAKREAKAAAEAPRRAADPGSPAPASWDERPELRPHQRGTGVTSEVPEPGPEAYLPPEAFVDLEAEPQPVEAEAAEPELAPQAAPPPPAAAPPPPPAPAAPLPDAVPAPPPAPAAAPPSPAPASPPAQPGLSPEIMASLEFDVDEFFGSDTAGGPDTGHVNGGSPTSSEGQAEVDLRD